MATDAKTTTTIPVRLNLLIRIDPAQWTADQAPAVDADVIAKALIGAGISEEQATAMAAQLAARPADANAPAAVRTAVREYVLGAVRQLEKLTAAGATIADADRQAGRPTRGEARRTSPPGQRSGRAVHRRDRAAPPDHQPGRAAGPAAAARGRRSAVEAHAVGVLDLGVAVTMADQRIRYYLVRVREYDTR